MVQTTSWHPSRVASIKMNAAFYANFPNTQGFFLNHPDGGFRPARRARPACPGKRNQKTDCTGDDFVAAA